MNYVSMCFAVVFGAILGVIISWVTNCTLAEISLNKFFSVYFGILFAAIGAVIIWRIRSSRYALAKKSVLNMFALTVIISGALCVLLDIRWFHFSSLVKIPLYGILGMAVCFAFTFSFVDLLNWVVGACEKNGKPMALVDSPQQVHLVLIASVVMGFIFGLLFGIMDIEDKVGLALRNSLIHEENYCI